MHRTAGRGELRIRLGNRSPTETDHLRILIATERKDRLGSAGVRRWLVGRGCYAALTRDPDWLSSAWLSGTDLLAVNVAPWGSLMTVILTQGASNGAARTRPPSAAALSADASASSTANVTLQCTGIS